MRVMLDVEPQDLIDAIADTADHAEIEKIIMDLDEAACDQEFTLQLVRKLIVSLRQSQDPMDPVKLSDFADLFEGGE